MRIGIDATALPVELYGAGNYIVNLVHALARVNSDSELVVFTKPVHAPLFQSQEHIQVASVALPMRTWRIAWEQTILPRLIRRHELDVFHSPHYTIPFAAPCATVVTFHDMTFFLYPQAHLLYKRFFFRTIIPISARRASAVIAISESTRQDILRLTRISPSKVFGIPYGVGSNFRPEKNPAILDEIRRQYNLPAEFLAYVGNLEPRKNLPMLLRAFARLVKQGLPHDLVLAGSRGWKDNAVFSACQELGLSKRVHFIGFVPQAKLPALYSACSAFVYPSLYEGFGLPVLEALACGAVVVTSNVSSMPEVAGKAGILIDPQNVDDLTNALYRALTDQELRATLPNMAIERARLFSWERAAKETLALYARAAQLR